MGDFAAKIGWMAWTWQTLLFFGALVAVLALLTVLAALRPETPKAGLLRFATTRGDRLFVTLLGTAFIFLAFIRFGGDDFLYPGIAAAVLAAVLFRFA